MNRLDALVNWLSPGSGLKRYQARKHLESLRQIEAAGHGGRFENWKTYQTSPRDGNAGSLDIIRQRVRYLSQNYAYCSRALNALTGYIVNTGIVPHATVKGGKAKKDEILREWADHPYCDPAGRKNLYAIQQLAVRSLIRDGEIILKRVFSDDKSLPLPLQIEVLEADHLDTATHDRVLKNGNQIIQGIEFDKRGRRVAYHLFDEHPSSAGIRSLKSKRYDAEDIIHVFREDRAGQVRGLSWFTPIIVRLKDFDDYEDSQLTKQKISSLFVAVYKSLKPNEKEEKILEAGELKPGSFMVAPFGYEMQWSNPPQVEGFGEYAFHQKLTLGIGTEVPFMLLSGDYSKCNFSSSRMAMLNFFRFIEPVQQLEIIPQLCFPVQNWVDNACSLIGIDEKCKYNWQAPVRDMVDPFKEMKAKEIKVANGFDSHASTLREFGVDPYEFYEEQKMLQEYFDENDLKFPCDPRVHVAKAIGEKHENNN